MKTTTPALAAYLNSFAPSADQKLIFWDLFTITLQSGSCAGIANGQVLAYTNGDYPVAWNSLTYRSNSLLVSGLKYKATTGVSVDKQQITIAAYASMTIGDIPFLQAIQQGLFDGAEIIRERAFFTSKIPPLVPIGTVILFKGRVTSVDSCGRTTAKVSVESDLTLLKMQMPWKMYGANCQWQLYGPGCTLNRATYTVSGAVGAGSTASLINWASASANFQQGTLTFTSGANEGISVNIKTANSSSLAPMYPLPSAPATGDTFTAVYGCDHTLGAKFSGSISGTTLTAAQPQPGLIENGPLFGTGVAAGQTITGQITGPTGGAGTYTVSISQTVGSETMTTGQGCGKFANQANFEGFPFVPPPQVVSGPLATTADGSKD